MYKPFENCRALPAANTMGDFGGKAFIMHEKKVHLSCVIDEHLLQAIGKEVSSLLGLFLLFRTPSRLGYNSSRSHLLVTPVTNLKQHFRRIAQPNKRQRIPWAWVSGP